MRCFPCPYCKGQGSWVEPVLDYGQGPSYECGVCRGEGMIEINGPIHRQMKQWKLEERALDGEKG